MSKDVRHARSTISSSREAAFHILQAVQANKGNSDTLLHGANTAKLSPLDRNLATTLVMGVLRWQISLDAAIVPLLTRPGEPLPAPVAIALRLGAFQLLHLDRIPAHAAISESVELSRVAGQEHAAGMVNAVLRKLAAKQLELIPASPPPVSLLLRLALETAHPVWLVERWLKQYGETTARAICTADQHQTLHTVRWSDTADIPKGWQPGALLSCCIRREAASAAEAPTGSIFMDEGSQLVAEIAAITLPEKSQRHVAANLSDCPPAKILDCCAAPGGKTLILAERNPDAEILACDSSPNRLHTLRQRLKLLPHVQCLQADATAMPDGVAYSNFDRILCDVPCSGTGTLARNPEIRHRVQPADLVRHAERQRNILRAMLSRLAVGGRLVYSTCSLEPEENEDVVNAVLLAEPDYKVVDTRHALDELLKTGILLPAAHTLLTETALRDGFLRTLPGVHPCDGFFVAMIERNK